MKMDKVTPLHARVRVGNKIVPVCWEMRVSDPDYLVFVDSIKNYEAPFGDEVVDAATREEVIKFICDEVARAGQSVKLVTE